MDKRWSLGEKSKHVTFQNDSKANDAELSLYNKLKPKKNENEITNTLLKNLIEVQNNMLKKQDDIVEQLKLMRT